MRLEQIVLEAEVSCLGCGSRIPQAQANEINADVKDVDRWNADGGLFFDVCPCISRRPRLVSSGDGATDSAVTI